MPSSYLVFFFCCTFFHTSCARCLDWISQKKFCRKSVNFWIFLGSEFLKFFENYSEFFSILFTNIFLEFFWTVTGPPPSRKKNNGLASFSSFCFTKVGCDGFLVRLLGQWNGRSFRLPSATPPLASFLGFCQTKGLWPVQGHWRGDKALCLSSNDEHIFCLSLPSTPVQVPCWDPWVGSNSREPARLGPLSDYPLHRSVYETTKKKRILSSFFSLFC